MSNRITTDDAPNLLESLKQLSEAIEPRGIAPELKEFVQGMKVLVEKTSLEFIDGKPTTVSSVISKKNLSEYRKNIGENFVMDYNKLLRDRKDYLNMLESVIGAKNPLLKEMKQTADFLYDECLKPIFQRPNER